jgi:hypothetical protein
VLDLLRLFQREGEEPPATQTDLGGTRLEDVQAGYRDLLLELLQSGGVPADSVSVEVRYVGKAHDGLHVLLGMLRLRHWQRKASLRLMVGLPLLEHARRRRLRRSWLRDVSHFGGVWLHPSGQMLDEATVREIRALLQAMEAGDSTAANPNESIWSLPPELGGPSTRP